MTSFEIVSAIINGALLVATATATTIAWAMAIDAGRGKRDAEAARDAAVLAQQAAARSLDEANEIARMSAAVEVADEARRTERHHVVWEPSWDWEAGRWHLANRGLDNALDVVLTYSASGHARNSVLKEDVVEPHTAFAIEFPQMANGGGTPSVDWRVEWSTHLNNHGSDSGTWPSS